MKNLFIDTNIYLNFYHYSDDDLEELRKLLVAIKNRKIQLYTTSQILNEFRRNRESKIADALDKFSSTKIPDQFPQICKTYKEYKELMELLKKYESTKTELLQQLKDDIDAKCCKADEIIGELNKVSKLSEIDADILERAKLRCALGNPPGKKDSLGDAVNWEILLEHVPKGEDIHFVSDDKDYVSKVDRDKLADFLNLEWNEKKESQIHYYPKLSAFFRKLFPNIKLASELDKEINITALITSPNFSSTHIAVKKLSEYSDFTDSEIEQIIEGSISNDQISRIWDDDDVHEFLHGLIDGNEDILEPETLDKFHSIYGE